MHFEWRRSTDLFDAMLVPERLSYPSSILRWAVSLPSSPNIDLIVDVELPRRSKPGRSSIITLFLLAKLPYKLEPG